VNGGKVKRKKEISQVCGDMASFETRPPNEKI
jgi:hypothetical protein